MTVYAVSIAYEGAIKLFSTKEKAEAYIASNIYNMDLFIETFEVE